jgi:hypothetical protein
LEIKKRKPSLRTLEQKAAYAAKKRAIRAADPERMRQYDRQRRAVAPEKFRERDRARWTKDSRKRESNRRFCEQNKDKVRFWFSRWRAANPEKVLANNAKRRALQRGAVVVLTAHEQAEVIALYAKARALTELVGESYHVDHIKPLSKGGLHHPDNLQVLRGRDNLRKGNKT